jgi:hypothetical protein
MNNSSAIPISTEGVGEIVLDAVSTLFSKSLDLDKIGFDDTILVDE